MDVTFTTTDPQGNPYPAGVSRCEQTGCLVLDSERDAHAAAHAGDLIRAALAAPAPTLAQALAAKVEDQSAALGEATAAIAALQAQLAALKAAPK